MEKLWKAKLGDYFKKVSFDDKEVAQFRTFAHKMETFFRTNFKDTFGDAQTTSPEASS